MTSPRSLRTGLLVLAATLLALPVSATPIVNGSFAALSGSESVVDFDEVALTPFQTVTNEFAGLGISFAPNTWFENIRTFPGFDGASLANFRSTSSPGGSLPPIPVTVSFGSVMTDFAAYFATNSGQTITLTAQLGGALVETFTFTDAVCCNGHILGFQNIAFDSLQITGSNLIIMDEFHFENASVSEAGEATLLATGLLGLALAGAPRRSRSRADA